MQSPSTPTCMLDDFRCRLCFTSSDINLQPLFPPGEDCFVNDLLSRIYDCLTIHVSFLEDFCSVICSVCRDKINSFYNFKKQCQSNDGYLREKRSRQMNGVDLERMSRMNRDQPVDASASQCKVEEPQEEDMMLETKSMFAPDPETTAPTSTPEATVNIPLKVDVAVQISGTSSSESFRGFPNELIKNSVTEGYEMKGEPPVLMDDNHELIKNSVAEGYEMKSEPPVLMDNNQDCHELIKNSVAEGYEMNSEPPVLMDNNQDCHELIKNSVAEDYEMKSEPPVLMDDIQECHVPLEKLDIKPSVGIQRSNTKKGPRGKYRKQIKTEQAINKNKLLSPRMLRKKAVLYFDGYEYRKPRTCHGGSIQWKCCKISCPATLQQKPDGKMKLNAKHQQHQQQVVNDGMILDRKMRKRVPFLVTNNNHKKKFIYNDSFRYHFSQKLSNGQTVWTCEDQQEGCKAYVRITDDFRYVSPIFQHNHTAEMVVRRRIVDKV